MPPTGANNPIYYVLAEAPGSEEVKEKKVLVGPSGSLFRDALKELDIEESSVRFFNAVPYRCISDRNSNRNPTLEELSKFSIYAKADIEKTKPKKIICLGKSALISLFPNFDGSVSSNLNRERTFNKISTRLLYHPSFVLRRGGKNSKYLWESYKDSIKLAFELTQEDFTYNVFTQDQVDDFLDLFSKSKVLGYDLETSSLETLSSDFEIAGVGLSDTVNSAYLVIKDFWEPSYNRGTSVFSKVGKFLKDKDESEDCQICVFNLKYEVPATLNAFGVELNNVYDVMQYAKASSKYNIRGGLKAISQRALGGASWSDDVSTWLENTHNITFRIKPTKKFSKSEHDLLKEIGYKELETCLNGKEPLNNREKLIYESMSALRELASKYRLENFEDRLGEIILGKLDIMDIDSRFTEIPREIIAKYCCKDSYNTARLKMILDRELTENNLLDAGKYYNEHAYLGYNMELNGVSWDDAVAEDLHEKYCARAMDSLKSFYDIKRVQDILNLTPEDIITINSTDDIEVLKGYFNPNSNHKKVREKFSDMVMTNTIKIALMLNNGVNSFSQDCPNFLEIKDKINELPLEKRLEALTDFRKNLNLDLLSAREKKILQQYASYKLEATSSEVMELLFHAATTLMGCDPDNPDTWGDEMRIIYCLRLFKKTVKVVSSFISGAPGRGAVFSVDKGDMESGKRLLIRHSRYFDLNKKENQKYLYAPRYSCNTAITKRWKSPMHVIPWSSEIRDLFKSRYGDGLIVHYDFSQMEIRLLAVMAGEDNLLEAFENGEDIHAFIASFVWDKPQEEVTQAERRYSKMASFSIIYGKTSEGLGRDFLHGDMEKAKFIYEKFFGMFPKIKEFVESCHVSLVEDGYVKTLWGDKIFIDYNDDDRKALSEAKRHAQNYPIQSSASNVAGISSSRLNQYLLSQGMKSKIFSFTHDSSDIDTPGDEFLSLCKLIPEFSENLLYDMFGIPASIDLEVGVSNYRAVSLEKVNDSYVESRDGKLLMKCKFKSRKGDLQAAIEKLGDSYDISYAVEKEEETNVGMSELFLTRRAYSLDIGKTFLTQEGDLIIKQR